MPFGRAVNTWFIAGGTSEGPRLAYPCSRSNADLGTPPVDRVVPDSREKPEGERCSQDTSPTDTDARLAGDEGFATHELAAFASRYRNRLTLVHKFPPDAVLHDPSPRRLPGQRGRPRVVGKRLTVQWHGGGTQRIEVVAGTGHWYQQGQGLIRVKWVHLRDLTGDHREEYFFSTDVRMTVQRIVETFVGRWDIEVTFEEMREHLGLETTRGRCRNTVLRVEPCLFGLYTLVVYWFAHLPKPHRLTIPIRWAGQRSITFSDALASVRYNAWDEFLFLRPHRNVSFEKLTAHRTKTRLDALVITA